MVKIDHVIVLVLENRSFDHLLGYLDHSQAERFDGLRGGGPYTNPGWANGPAVPASSTGKRVLPVDPDHSHDAVMEQLGLASGASGEPTNSGFVTSYERKGRGLAPATFGGLLGRLVAGLTAPRGSGKPGITARGPLAMRCQPPEHVPVLSTLAREFAVCQRWFCSVPGETWPNRNFLHAATSDGETNIDIRFYQDKTIFEQLEDHHQSWHIYHDDTPQVWAFNKLWDTPARHANWYPLARFFEHVADGALPSYAFLEPNHRPPLHTPDHDPRLGGTPDLSNSQHPGNNVVPNEQYDGYNEGTDTDFQRAEALIATVYEALRDRPELFERCLLLVTYDEHGGLYDHVPPPRTVAPGDPQALPARLLHRLLHRNTTPFDFTRLGPRVPAVVVSPYIASGTIDTTVRDHACVSATLRALFAPDAGPLTRRDRAAEPFHTVLNLAAPRRGDLPNLSAYTRPADQVGVLTGTTAPLTATSPAEDPRAAAPEPAFYRDFVRLAKQVQTHLEQVGEPEVAAVTAQKPPFAQAAEISEQFAMAAHRHRHPDQAAH